MTEKLEAYRTEKPVILALPRGGVPVGFEIAKAFNCPLEVIVSRKLGAPFNAEFGIGAISVGGTRVLDRKTIDYLGLSQADVGEIERNEKMELLRRDKKYRGNRPFPIIAGKTVILVDDGSATGLTARAAVKAVLERKPKKLVVAIPVCAQEALSSIRSDLRENIDEIVCLESPENFDAVGLWFENFGQVTDDEVVKYLQKSRLRELG